MKELKIKAKNIVKKNLWKSIVVCFIASAIFTLGYKYNTEKKVIHYENNITTNFNVKNNLDIVENTFNKIFEINGIQKIVNYKPTRGVLSVFFNQITGAGSIIIGILNVNNEYLFHNSIPSLLIMILGLGMSVLFYIFVVNIVVVGKNRYFLEHHSYDEVSYDKLLFIYRIKKTKHVAYIMFKKNVYSILWYFTIIGGFIKRYEYSMIPYILAENPELDSKTCFELSKKMTNGYKLKMFWLDLSLLGWYLLGGITLGLSNIFYFNPYKECIYAEIYMDLRKKLNSEYFKDKYLDVSGLEYPNDKYFIPESKKRKWLKINYKVDYSVINLILLFFTFSFIGWIWEVSLHLFNDGVFVNRGTMFGPILPIYGWGGILIIILLKKFRDNPFQLFISSFVLCGIVEYFTAWYLEVTKAMKWWNYSGYFLNLNGRICLEGLLVFALAGCAATYFVAPFLNNIYNKFKREPKLILAIIFIILYGIDMRYSSLHPNTGDGISKPISETYIIEKEGIYEEK